MPETPNSKPITAPTLPSRDGSYEDPRDRVRLVAEAPRGHYRDLPIAGSRIFDEVQRVRAAVAQLQQGMFQAPAELAEAMLSDDRIEGIVQTRVDALFSLPLELNPGKGGKDRQAASVAAELQENWERFFPTEELKSLLRWALQLRFAPAQMRWALDGKRWSPRLSTWNPRYSWWRWDTRSYWTATLDGTAEIIPGDGRWLVYTPQGYVRGWIYGFVAPLARLFLMRSFSYRDWARWAEVHGLPIRKAIVPADRPAEEKEQFVSDLLAVGSEATLRLERDQAGVGFDVELLEAVSQSWEGFKALADAVESNAAILILGQNTSTSIKGGGSYAAANVHDRIREDRLEQDARSLAPVLYYQAIRPWALFNFGDADLAPYPSWSTKAPENRAATAKTFVDAGTALAAWRAAGLNVDRVKYAAQFGLPLDESKPIDDALERAAIAAAKPVIAKPADKSTDKTDTTPDREDDEAKPDAP